MQTDFNFRVQKLREMLHRKRQVMIFTHLNPDGDAIGSAMGLCNFLKHKHTVSVVVPNRCPEFLQWFPGFEHLLVFKTQEKAVMEKLKEAEIFFYLDFNTLSRLDTLEHVIENHSAYKVLIDHHPKPKIESNIAFSDTGVSSAAELLYIVLKNLDEQAIDKNVATCIFAGIMTDTGCFSLNSSKPQTYKIVSELLEFGIHKDEIFSNIYENYSEKRMRLMGYCLNEKMKLFPANKAAIIALTKEELSRFNFKAGDSEGFVNLPFSIKGIKISCLLIEYDNFVRMSFRSKGNFDVDEFSGKYFNGGGHKNAAGGRSYVALAETIENFETALNESFGRKS